ncbi:energy-coupling factor ABC transporter ATP-binding protein [bacterium]|nr:energy-coupling factor ABC transporter ATP-binding protein [bacterium]
MIAPSTDTLLHCAIESCDYPDGRRALGHVHFSIAKGERVGLIGPNGAGKSTLLRALLGLQSVTGSITIDGITLSASTADKVRTRIGLVFQQADDMLFSPTVCKDIAFGLAAQGLPGPEIEQRTSDVLRDVDLLDRAECNPAELSVGEQRRAAIAAVIAMQPAVLAMDEPASNLDPRHRRMLIDWLNSRPGLTLLLASHDLDLVAACCDRVILLSTNVAADGPTRRILTDEKLLRAHELELPPGMQSTTFRHQD